MDKDTDMKKGDKGDGETVPVDQATLARNFTISQHGLGWKLALKTNPKALFWCSYALFSCILWGYDGLASSIVIAIDRFREDYGVKFDDPKSGSTWVVPAISQLALAGGSLVGLLIGGIGAGFIAKRWGRQLCMALSYAFTTIGVFLQWYSSPGKLMMLFGGKILTGIPLGVFVTIAPTYCSEIAPLPLRGAVTSAVNFSIVFGQSLAYIVIRATQDYPDSRSYQFVFGVQWIFAAVGLSILFFFPESPYFLVEHENIDKAIINARRLYGAKFDVEGLIASIQELLKAEAENQRVASFRECFKGTNRLRTLIAMSTFFIQNICGIAWIIGYMAYFLQLGGLSESTAFNVTMYLSFVMLVGNMFGWVFVERYGRRSTALYGCITLAASLLLIGITACIQSKSAIWAQVAFMALWSFTYQSTIGSVAWPIISEVSKSSLRGHTQSLATITTGIVGAIAGVGLPFAMNPDLANLGGKIAFIYGSLLSISCVGVFLYYPETKGKTFAEIDRLFEAGVAPRDFSKALLPETNQTVA